MKETTFIDKQIDRVKRTLLLIDPETKEYSIALSNLENLESIRAKKKPLRLDNPVIQSAIVHGVFLGVTMLFETRHVWTSRRVTSYLPRL